MPNDLWFLLEEHNNRLKDRNLDGHEVALKKIREVAENQNMTIACQDECLKTVREVTVQLRMMKWGYLGPAEASAGQYLAYHRKEIGHYFSTSINNQWPYQPLHREPNDFVENRQG